MGEVINRLAQQLIASRHEHGVQSGVSPLGNVAAPRAHPMPSSKLVRDPHLCGRGCFFDCGFNLTDTGELL